MPLFLIPLSGLGERLDTRFPFYRRITNACAFACVCFLIVALTVLPLLDVVTILFVYIQAHMLLHQKSTREYQYMFLMALFLLLAACALTPEAGIGVALVLFLISAAWAFLSLQMYAEFERADHRVAPDIEGLAGAKPGPAKKAWGLWDWGIALAAMGVSGSALAFTVGLFVITPRFEAGILGRDDTVQFQTGLQSTVDLTEGGLIKTDNTAVMRVEFPDEPNGRYDGTLFWRCSTLDSYIDGVWTRRGTTMYSEKLYPRSFQRGTTHVGVVRNLRGAGRLVHQSIYMDAVPVEGVPCLTLVQRLEAAVNPKEVKLNWGGLGDLTVLMGRRGSRRLEYEVWSEVEEFTPETLRQKPGGAFRGRRRLQILVPAHPAQSRKANRRPGRIPHRRPAHSLRQGHGHPALARTRRRVLVLSRRARSRNPQPHRPLHSRREEGALRIVRQRHGPSWFVAWAFPRVSSSDFVAESGMRATGPIGFAPTWPTCGSRSTSPTSAG